MYSFLLKLGTLSATLILSSCLATIDKGLMKVSNSISEIDPITGKREISLESTAAEITRANAQTTALLKNFKDKGLKVNEQNKQFNSVVRVFNRLKKVIHRQDLPWKVHLIEDKSWNAFTIGGGKIFVHTGLFEGNIGVQNDEELAAVLAHEIAHINARHASEKTGKLLVSRLADKDAKTDSYEASFTTNQEREADKYSVIYLALAGYNPQKGADIWHRMHRHHGSNPKNALYSHPLNNERARNLTHYANITKKYYTKGVIHTNYKEILQKNDIFTFKTFTNKEAGSGGGVLSILEVLGNTYIENEKAKQEEKRRLGQ